MSNQVSDSKSVSKKNTLPQFIQNPEQFQASYPDPEEGKNSWLANNLQRLMIGVSAIWFAIVLIYITQFFGWSNLFLMMPDEFGGFLAGVTLPLAIIWVVMAYIDRGTSFKQEAKLLRAYMNQIVYPEDGASQTVKAMADAIRSQVVELQEITKLATAQTDKIKNEIGTNIAEFSKVVSILDNYSSKTIVDLSDGVKFLVNNIENISAKSENSARQINEYNRAFMNDSGQLESNLNHLFALLDVKVKELQQVSQTIGLSSDVIGDNILKANEKLAQFNAESAENLNLVLENINTQVSNLGKVSSSALESCGHIQKQIGDEVKNLESRLNRSISGIQGVITQSVSNLDSCIAQNIDSINESIKDNSTGLVKIFDAAAQKTLSGFNSLTENMRKEIEHFDESVVLNINKVSEASNQHQHQFLTFTQDMEERSSAIIDKFTEHSNTLAQEVDKIMVRSQNLEDSIHIQVDNLSDVSDNIAASMGRIENSLRNNIDQITEQSASANDGISSYIETVEAQTQKLAELSSSVIDRAQEVAEILEERQHHLSNTCSDITSKMEQVNTSINDSIDNLRQNSSSAIDDINNVADVMNKYAGSMTEASSVVTAQSQISEAALAQQQKNITSSANRVEEIKSELKRQIEELSQISSVLQSDASETVDKLKKQTDEILQVYKEIIDKNKDFNTNLEEQSEKFDTSANKTLAKVTNFENVLVQRSQNMESLSKLISDRANKVDEALERQIKAVDAATENSNSVHQKLATSFEQQNTVLNSVAENTTGYVADIVQSLEDKAGALSIIFKQQQTEFEEIGGKVSEAVTTMHNALTKQMSEVEESAEKIFQRMTSLEEENRQRSQTMLKNSNTSIDKLSEIENILGEKGASIAELVNNVKDGLESISAQVENKMNLFDTTIKNVKEETSFSVKQILGNCSKLQNVNTSLINDTKNISKTMEEHVKNLDTFLVKSKLQSEDINNVFEQQKNALCDTINSLSTQARLGEAAIAQQYKYLSDAATDIAQKVKEVNDNFKNNTDAASGIATKLVYDFDVLSDRLIKSGEAIQKTSKNSLKSIEEVNLSLGQCSEDLDAAIHHSVQNIGGVFKDYEKYLAAFNTVTAETSTGVIEINNLISEQSNKMVQISDDTKKLVECFNTVLNDTSMVLSNRANDAYDKVKSLGENLKNLSIQIEETTNLSAAHMNNSGDKLRASIGEIAANAERISNEIRSSGEVFAKQSAVLVSATEDTVSKVQQAMKELISTGKEFNEKGEIIVKQSIHFNDLIADQTKQLSEQTKSAKETLIKLSGEHSGAKIDNFLKDASVIIEKLESISIDINRIFNPKDEEDLWKRFYGGDTSVFVRYLSRNMSKQQVASIRKLFEQNSDFRNIVNSYLSEFEILITKAQNNEHSGLLLSVVSGADIGKLYYILAKSLDKIS